jgi:heat shock protein HtpX
MLYMLKSIGGFFKSNWIYLIVIILYFLIAWTVFDNTVEAFFGLLSTYSVSFVIAFSPAGEDLLRLLHGVRKLETKKEIQRLKPIFEEVYREIKKQYPIGDDIEIYIIDVMSINACAIGKRTVAVTRGAMQSLSADELKGLIAHELGHIAFGHPKLILLATLGNGIFTILMLMLKAIILFFEAVAKGFQNEIMNAIVILIKFVTEACIFVFFYIVDILLAVNSREHENRADLFTCFAGYGQNLADTLYVIQELTISKSAKISDRLKASHPNIAMRIGRIERFLDSQSVSEA